MFKHCTNRKGTLLTDLSHKLITTKLNVYGFGFNSLKLISNYLSHRKQRTKINSFYCLWEEVLFGVVQGSILAPILFNTFLSDLFLIIKGTDILILHVMLIIMQSTKQVTTLMTSLHIITVIRKALEMVFR